MTNASVEKWKKVGGKMSWAKIPSNDATGLLSRSGDVAVDAMTIDRLSEAAIDFWRLSLKIVPRRVSLVCLLPIALVQVLTLRRARDSLLTNNKRICSEWRK